MQNNLLRVWRENVTYIKQTLNKITSEINFEVRKKERWLKLRGKALCCLQITELIVLY